MHNIRDLEYPVLMVAQKNEYWGQFMVVGGPARYFTFTHLPVLKQFEAGTIFDGKGQVYRYDGMTVWPAFPEKSWAKAILEFLVVFAVLFRTFALFLNAGPRLTESQEMNIDEFKSEILSALRVHTTEAEIEDLSALFENGYEDIPPAKDARSAILWVDRWIEHASLMMADPDDVDGDHPAAKDN